MTTKIFDVELNDYGDWVIKGSILLRHDAPKHEVEHALAPLGIYMPRGSDTLEWGDFGVIYEYGEMPAVRLMPR